MDKNEYEIVLHQTDRKPLVFVDKKGVKYIINSLRTGGFQIFTKKGRYDLFAGTTDGIVKGKSFYFGLYKFHKDAIGPGSIETLEI